MTLADWQFLPLPLGLQVRTSTLLTAAAIWAVVAWQTRNPWRGYVVVSAWIAVYELAYVFTGAALGRWRLLDAIPTTGMLGWVALAWTLGHRPASFWTLIFGLGWASWIAAGFHANDHHQIASGLQEAFNVGTKTALGLAYLLGSWKLPRWLPGRLAEAVGQVAAEGDKARGAHEKAIA